MSELPLKISKTWAIGLTLVVGLFAFFELSVGQRDENICSLDMPTLQHDAASAAADDLPELEGSAYAQMAQYVEECGSRDAETANRYWRIAAGLWDRSGDHIPAATARFHTLGVWKLPVFLLGATAFYWCVKGIVYAVVAAIVSVADMRAKERQAQSDDKD
jgi:hypothetical protein